MAKSKATKKREERFRSSLLLNKDKRKKSIFTLLNAKEALTTKINLGGGIGNDASFSKTRLESTLERRWKVREKTGKFAPNGYDYSESNNDKFIETEKTICTSIRQPKKNASAKQQKIAVALEKNERDAISFERSNLTEYWKLYCNKKNKDISFRLFESKMNQSKFKADVLALR